MPRFPWFNLFGLIDWAWQHRSAKRPRNRSRLGIESLEDRVVPSAGDLDLSFGTGGIVQTTMGSPASRIQDMILLPDGKIIAAGTAHHNTGTSHREEFGLVRYLPDGSLDTTFGTAGKVFTNINNGRDTLAGIALQTDGKIIAVGRTGFSGDGWAVVRYNSNGSLDATFGTGGIVVSDLQPGSDGAYDVVIQPDGKIVVVGASGPSPTLSTSYFAVARYNTDGSLDEDFGNGAGFVLTPDFGSSGANPNKVMLQTDGRILAFGSSSNSGGNFGFAVARYNTDGSLDTNFGTDGIIKINAGLGINGFEHLLDAVLLPDGKIVTGGGVWNQNNTEIALLRFTSDGDLDTTFGDDGITIVNLGDTESVQALALQSDGKIVASGSTFNKSWVGRFNANGTLDLPFGPTDTGVNILNISTNDLESFDALLLMPNGDIVAGGWTTNFTLARFQGDKPIARVDTYAVNEDTTLTVEAPGVLVNDTEPDDLPLTAHLVSDVTHGTLTLNSDGSFVYVPHTNFSGVDTFTYKVNNGDVFSNDTTVNITVHAVADAPNLNTLAVTAFEDLAGAFSITAARVDTDGSETLSITISGVPANVTLSAGINNGGGNWTLTPAQLSGLALTGADDANFNLTVKATTTETSNANQATTTQIVAVQILNVAPTPYIGSAQLIAPLILWDYSPATTGAVLSNNTFENVQTGQHFAERIFFASGTQIGGMDIYMSAGFAAVGQSATITFYSDAAGQPGSVLTQFTAIVTVLDTKGAVGGNLHRVHVDFATPVSLSANTPYWVGMAGTSVTWRQAGLINPNAPGDSRMAEISGNTFAAFQSTAAGDMAFRLYGTTAQPPGITVNEGVTVALIGTTVDPGSDTFTYAWQVKDSNDQTIAVGTDLNFSFIPPDGGTFTVTYTVTDDNGGVGVDRITVHVIHATRPMGLITPAPNYDQPLFKWNPVANAHHYELHVIDTTTHQAVIHVFDLATARYTTPLAQALTPGHSYVWHVIARDEDGAVVGQVAEVAFSLASLPAATHLSPKDSIAPNAGYDLPTFTWTSAPGTHRYWLYVIDTTTNRPVIDRPNLTSTSYSPASVEALTPGHSYVWYVVNYGTNGVFNYLPGQTFSLANLPAATLNGPSGLISPSVGFDLPTFSWSLVPSAHHYWLYVVDTTTNKAVIDQRNLTGNSYVPGPTETLTPGHSYIWYVVDYSSNGQAYNFLPGRTFTLENLPAATLNGLLGTIAPSDGYDKPTFTWNPVATAHHYWLYVVDTTTNKAVIDRPNLLGTAYTPTDAELLTPGHSYIWYVVDYSTNGQAYNFLPGRPFSLAALEAPTLTGPAGIMPAVAGYEKPTFAWSDVPGASRYWLYVVNTTTKQPVIDLPNLVGNSFTPSAGEALTPSHDYIWYVVAFSTNGLAYSYLPGQTFSLAALPSPILSGPTAHISEVAPTFTWSAVPLASSYGVYVLDLTTNESRTGIVFTTSTSWTPTTAFVRGRSYRWWVASVSENGSFVFTENWLNFTIDL